MFHVELAPLGGIFGPLKSDLGVFWPFRGTDFIMGKNKNANFSKPFNGRILISWNLIVDTFFCTKIKKFTIGNFFSLDAGSRPKCDVIPE